MKLRTLACVLLLVGSVMYGQNPITFPQVQTSRLGFPVQTLNAVGIAGATLSVVGAPGQATWCYWASANFQIGNVLSSLGCVNNAPNTLSVSNYVSILPFSYPAGVTTVDILATSSTLAPTGACNCAVATGLTSGGTNHQSNSLSSYTVSLVSPSAFRLWLTNEVVGAGSTHLLLRNEAGTQITDLSAAGASPFQSLTTTGTSGAAALIAGVLNVPQYSSGIGGSIASGQVAFGSGVNSIQGNAGLTYSPTVTGLSASTTSTTSGTNQGAVITGSFNGVAATQEVGAFIGGTNQGSGTVTNLIGVEGLIHNTGTGAVTTADALFVGVNGLEPGPISLFDGLHIQDHTATGATNSFGILLDNGTRAIGFNGSASGQNLSVTSNNINLGKGPTGGSFNLFLGTGTTGGVTTTTGTKNVCVNASNLTCFFSITSGGSNVAVGQSALFSLTSGSNNMSVGNGNASVATGSGNNAVGFNANNGADTTSVNAFGNGALQHNLTNEASAFGNTALQLNTTGLNEAFGAEALSTNTTGTNNQAFGSDGLLNNVTGSHNVAMGARALQQSNANDNTAIGYLAGYTNTAANANTSGTFNTWIGSGTGPGSTTQFSNQTVIGASATATCSSCVVLGRTADTVQIPSGLTFQVTIYSAAGTPLPSCTSPLKGTSAVVSDSTVPTFLGTYTSGGAVLSPVICNGTNWVTY